MPLSLYDPTCKITETVVIINMKLIIGNINCNLENTARTEIAAPRPKDPVSPINTFAGYELNFKNPKHAPVNAAANTVMFCMSEENPALPSNAAIPIKAEKIKHPFK